MPYTLSEPALKASRTIPVYNMKSLDIEKLTSEDQNAKGSPYRYSVFEDVNIDLKESSLKQSSQKAGGDIWSYIISAPGAKSIQLIFSEFNVPHGATLFIYNDSDTKIYGAFTSENMQDDKTFVIADFGSDNLNIEYFEPFNKEFEGKLLIGMIGQAYRDPFKSALQDSLIGANCYDGKDLQNQKHAVEKITFVDNNKGYACTGTLLNNTRNDGIPYFLTAHHCISTPEAAATLVAYFNYEAPACSGASVPLNQTISGSTLLNTGLSSDYTLLLLSKTPPAGYLPYYAGWDISNVAGSSTYTIHHPSGELKSISADLAPPVTNTSVIWWGSTEYSPSGSHWEVNYDIGRTESGSSGAPLFNDQNRVIGQLHGGGDLTDFFGKFSYSWEHSKTGKTLKYYLNPDGTDTLFIDGYYPQDNRPDSKFFTEYSNVCTGTTITLDDGSAFNPDTRLWKITPGTYSYTGGTDSLSANPVVQFNSPGNYSVQLIVENDAGSDTATITNYVIAGDDISSEVFPVNNADSCLCNFESLTLLARGASNYSWSLADTLNFTSENTVGDSLVISGMNPELPDSVNIIEADIVASQGSCRDTVSFRYPLLSQPNDDLVKAIQISIGLNGPFSNKCASVEIHEPVPPHFSCTNQMSWCNETGVDILHNSVWFRFVAPPSGIVSLRSQGFDNELAIYDAETFEDIFQGKWTLLAANDDRSTADSDPVIYSINVTPGKTYYVQVDGSGGNQEGEFFLTLDNKAIISEDYTPEASRLIIYPVPAEDHVIIQMPGNLSEVTEIEVFDIAGVTVYRDVATDTGRYVNLDTGSWMQGLYIVKIVSGETIFYGKIIK